ncbi:MAG: hypothetical protein KTR26_09750, partial [Flammeovirgaceae bacterium]|nr:hypothetical protein [Flammeovirgaceae bacterium]
DDLGLSSQQISEIKKLQVFGIQVDELWSFVQNKKRKRKKAAQKFWNKIPQALRSCNFETDHWEAYHSIIPPDQHKVGKALTFYIEGLQPE